MNWPLETKTSDVLENMSNLELARILAQRTAISPSHWHRLKNDRQAQALQQLTAALIYLLKGETEEALARINQAQGWLNKTVHPLPCPNHGNKKNSEKPEEG